VLLAPLPHRLQNEGRDTLAVLAAGGHHLLKARGVDVERLDGEVNLVIEAPCSVVVETPGGLRKRARRFQHAMTAEGIAEHASSYAGGK
jgi:hypothetical protein